MTNTISLERTPTQFKPTPDGSRDVSITQPIVRNALAGTYNDPSHNTGRALRTIDWRF